MACRSDTRERLGKPACRDATDPIERIFSLVVQHRPWIVEKRHLDDRSTGSWVVGTHDPELTRAFLAPDFRICTDAVLECLLQAGNRLPEVVDRVGLAEFVSTTIEGARMHARAFGDVAYFDRAVQELRNYIEMLLYGRPRLSDPLREVLTEIGCRPLPIYETTRAMCVARGSVAGTRSGWNR